jgi:Ca2+-binding RTX toxin-like protein
MSWSPPAAISGLDGNDTVLGGTGSDTVNGGAGDDSLSDNVGSPICVEMTATT